MLSFAQKLSKNRSPVLWRTGQYNDNLMTCYFSYFKRRAIATFGLSGAKIGYIVFGVVVGGFLTLLPSGCFSALVGTFPGKPRFERIASPGGEWDAVIETKPRGISVDDNFDVYVAKAGSTTLPPDIKGRVFQGSGGTFVKRVIWTGDHHLEIQINDGFVANFVSKLSIGREGQEHQDTIYLDLSTDHTQPVVNVGRLKIPYYTPVTLNGTVAGKPHFYATGVSFRYVARTVDGHSLSDPVEFWAQVPDSKLAVAEGDQIEIQGEEQPGYVKLAPAKENEFFGPGGAKPDYNSLLLVRNVSRIAGASRSTGSN